MTTQSATNIAQGDAHVGLQAGVVHIYMRRYEVSPEDSPEKTFRQGVAYLEGLAVGEARRLIEQAVARGYVTAEVRFYQLLALLSRRTLRQLGTEDFDRLESICEELERLECDDDWRRGLQTVLRFMKPADDTDPEQLMKELDALNPRQRDLILQHLDTLVEGAVEDQMWRRVVEQAKAERMAGGRAERIWMFFHAHPAHPRARPVRPASIPLRDWLRAGIGTAASAVIVAKIGQLVFQRGELPPLLAFLLALAGAVAFVVGGLERHFRRERLRAKEAELIPRQRTQPPPPGGFASKVDALFDKYFARYVPRGTPRAYWLQQTAGIRARLRDEVVEIYRERRIPAARIAWLVRHLVGEVRQGWEHDTLTAYRLQLRVPLTTAALHAAGIAAACAGVAWLTPAVVLTAPLSGTLCVLLAIPAGAIAAGAIFRISTERRRVRADEDERDRDLARRWEAFHHWERKLSRRPSDAEMAAWLECDRKILVDEALRHYGLKPSQVIAHAFIEAPARSTERAREYRGPWRYSKYRLLLFLLTDDGVRQVDIDLDFKAGTSRVTQRLNYRFDAVAAVGVKGVATQQQSFELMLVNGDPISVRVTEPITDDDLPDDSDEDPHKLSQIALDASGITHTLGILEGIAAEGKKWISNQRARTDKRLETLLTNVRDFID